MPNERIMVTRAKITRIADAIRERAEVSGGIELDDMPDLIRNISGGGGSSGVGGLIYYVSTSKTLNFPITSLV